MAEYDFRINQGADLTVPFLLLDETGEAINLAGYTAAMQIRSRVFSKDAIDTLTSKNGRLVIDENEGRITAKFPHSITETYPAQALVYDIEIASAENEITRILQGKIIVSAEVARV